MSKWNGINRNKKPRQVSKKKLASLPQEKEIRNKLKSEANGRCKICGEKPCAPTYRLELHELKYRSAGGKISEQNSVVCDSLCHEIIQRYRLHDKEQCIRMLIKIREISRAKAREIYQIIYNFAQEHELIRESK